MKGRHTLNQIKFWVLLIERLISAAGTIILSFTTCPVLPWPQRLVSLVPWLRGMLLLLPHGMQHTAVSR